MSAGNETKADHAAISRFLACEDFERLSARQEQFNPFKVLRIAHHEIRHSNVLAWLMNPYATHQFMDRFLKRFIAHIVLNPDNEEHKDLPDDVSTLMTQGFYDVDIRREYKNIDLLVVSESNGLVLLIENKVRSKESKDQLKRYEKIIDTEFEGYTILRVFLTPDSTPPQNADSYLVGSHLGVLEIIEQLVEIYGGRIPERERQFIDDYKTILREELDMDDETTRLCRKIYSEHKDAIDLIYTLGSHSSKDLVPAGTRFLEEHADSIQPTHVNSRQINFYPNLFENLPRLGNEKWNGGSRQVITVFFALYGDDKLKIVLEIGPFEDPNARESFLRYLNENGFPMSERAMQPERMYKRLCTATTEIKDWTDEDHVLAMMNKLYSLKKVQDAVAILKSATDTFEWGDLGIADVSIQARRSIMCDNKRVVRTTI